MVSDSLFSLSIEVANADFMLAALSWTIAIICYGFTFHWTNYYENFWNILLDVAIESNYRFDKIKFYLSKFSSI